MTWPRLWLGVRGVFCVLLRNFVNVASNKREKQNSREKRRRRRRRKQSEEENIFSTCVPSIVFFFFFFSNFNSPFLFFCVGRDWRKIIGATLRVCVCVLYCAVRDLGHLRSGKRNTMEYLKWGTGGHQAVHPSALTSSSSFLSFFCLFFFNFFFLFFFKCLPWTRLITWLRDLPRIQ